MKRSVIASEFATPEDIAAFKAAKSEGLSDIEAFKVGDNGIGCYGDSTGPGAPPFVALPPETMQEVWGGTDYRSILKAAKHQDVLVSYQGKYVKAKVGDVMPRLKNVPTNARIDLNPAVCQSLGIPKGAMVRVEWDRVEDAIPV